jgi:divalent metal cation (Fe/Co/Zn/Cd) transporter
MIDLLSQWKSIPCYCCLCRLTLIFSERILFYSAVIAAIGWLVAFVLTTGLGYPAAANLVGNIIALLIFIIGTYRFAFVLQEA